MKLYIAGPMRGYKNFNRDKFNDVERHLRFLGYDVFNPVSLDLAKGWSLESETGNTDDMEGFSHETLCDIVRSDIDELTKCDAIYLLPGWRKSKGAMAEYHVAMWLGLKDYYDHWGVID